MWVIRENAAKTKAAQREAAFFMTGGKISYFNENLNLKKMANTHVTHRRAWPHPMAARAAGMGGNGASPR
jgi:hypothetical protein